MKEKRTVRVTTAVLLLFYLLVLFYVCFFSEGFGREGGDTYRYNLTPFKEISRFYTYREQIGYGAFFLNFFGNILAFMPIGFLVPILVKKRHPMAFTIAVAFLLSLCIELIQLVAKVGSFDVDDLILNTAGGILGYFLYRMGILFYRRWRK